MSQFESKFIGGIEFVNVCSASEIFEKKGIKIQFDDDDDMQVAIIKFNGNLYCVDNICPHRHAEEIYNGILSEGNVTCPLHGWTYSLKSGENTNPKQGLKKLCTYDVFEENGYIWIEKPALKIPKWRQSEEF